MVLFIVFIIMNMHNCLGRKVEMKISGTVKNDLDKKALEAMKSWKAFFKNDYSIFIDLFYSQYSSSIYDLDKNLKSTIYEPICFYSIPIPEKNSNIDIYSLGADQQIGGDGMNKDIGNWNLNE